MDVFLASPWIPSEWVAAHHLQPRGIWPGSPIGAPTAAGACAFARAFEGKARQEAQGTFVFATSCDQMRRAYDALAEGDRARCFLFNLPSTWQTQTAREMYEAEVERLGRFLVGLGVRPPKQEELVKVMTESGGIRESLLAARSNLSSAAWARAVHQFHWDGTGPTASPALSREPDGVKLAILGGPMSAEHWDVLEAVESSGGRIVLNGTELGERTLLPPFPKENLQENPMAVLCRHYFDHIIDVYQRPNHRLYAWLKTRLAERQIHGIILWHHYGCDLWRAEAATIREMFKLPVLVLEAAEGRHCQPRDAGRVQAFLEMLR